MRRGIAVWAMVLMAAACSGEETASFAELSREAAAAREADRVDDAIQLYRRAVAMEPDWKEGLWFLGTLLYDRERFAEARDAMRRFVADEPDAGPGWVILGMSEFQTREYARALPHLRRGLAQGLEGRDEMKRSAWYFTGVLLTRFEHFDQSMEVLLIPRLTGAREDRLTDAVGVAALRMPLLPGEIPADRRDLIRRAGEAAMAYASHDENRAAVLLKALTVDYPKEPGVHFLYGDLLMKQKPEEGIQEMRRELEITPDHVAARIELASELVREGKAEDALPLAREAVDLDAGAFDAHLTLGQALVANGDFDAGIREMETARDVAPRVSRVRWALARAYFEAGRKADGDREAAEMERLRAEERKNEGSR